MRSQAEIVNFQLWTVWAYGNEKTSSRIAIGSQCSPSLVKLGDKISHSTKLQNRNAAYHWICKILCTYVLMSNNSNSPPALRATSPHRVEELKVTACHWICKILCTCVLMSNNYKEILPPVGRQNDKASWNFVNRQTKREHSQGEGDCNNRSDWGIATAKKSF